MFLCAGVGAGGAEDVLAGVVPARFLWCKILRCSSCCGGSFFEQWCWK